MQVTAIKDRMLELNQQINWVPEHVRDGSFGKWLEGARDWSISRNRFWGSPIPVWKSDDPAYPRIDVYGSLDELEADFGVRPDDLHRPAIDELTRPNPDDPTGRSTMRRIPDVLDCWFESGSMPFAQVHYPFENTDWFESHFPGDFIVEYIGQTRGWFYTLHVLATALFDRPAFQNCVAHGVLLGDDGQKLSKRLRNYPDPVEVFDAIGADAMRWSLLSSAAVRGGDMVADRRPMEEAVRQVLLPIWNAWYFLTLYANARRADDAPDGERDGPRPLRPGQGPPARRGRHRAHGRLRPVGRLRRAPRLPRLAEQLVHPPVAATASGPATSRPSPPSTSVLDVLCRVAAPLLPMLTDTIWPAPHRASPRCTWPTGPTPRRSPHDPELVAAMDAVREVCSAASSVRKAEGLRVRLPLATLTVASPDAPGLRPVPSTSSPTRSTSRRSSSPTTSPRWPSRWSPSSPRCSAPAWAPTCRSCSAPCAPASGSAPPTAASRSLGRRASPTTSSRCASCRATGTAAAPLPANRGVVALDVEVTPELEAEGLARDLVRAVNEARRTEGLHVSDRIHLVIDADAHHDVRRGRRGPPRPHHGRGAGRRAGGGRQRQGPPPPRSTATGSSSSDGRAIHLSIARADA